MREIKYQSYPLAEYLTWFSNSKKSFSAFSENGWNCLASYPAKTCLGYPMDFTIVRNSLSDLWIFGKPMNLGHSGDFSLSLFIRCFRVACSNDILQKNVNIKKDA